MSVKWADSLNSLKRRQGVLLSIPMHLRAHSGSKRCLIQHLGKTGSLPHLYVSVMQMQDICPSYHWFVTLLTSILRRVSALRIGQIAEKLCHLILKVYQVGGESSPALRHCGTALSPVL